MNCAWCVRFFPISLYNVHIQFRWKMYTQSRVFFSSFIYCWIFFLLLLFLLLSRKPCCASLVFGVSTRLFLGARTTRCGRTNEIKEGKSIFLVIYFRVLFSFAAWYYWPDTSNCVIFLTNILLFFAVLFFPRCMLFSHLISPVVWIIPFFFRSRIAASLAWH